VKNIRCYFSARGGSASGGLLRPAPFHPIFPQKGAELVRIGHYSFAFIILFEEKLNQKCPGSYFSQIQFKKPKNADVY